MKLFLAHRSLLTSLGRSGALASCMIFCGCGESSSAPKKPQSAAAVSPSPAPVAGPPASEGQIAPPISEPTTRSTPPASDLPSKSEGRQVNLRMLGEALSRYIVYNEGRLPAHISELYKRGFVMDLGAFSLPGDGSPIANEGQIDTLTDYEMVTKVTKERPLLLVREKHGTRDRAPLALYSDRTIRTVERSSPGELAVPSVIGLTAADAKARLSKFGYNNPRFVIADQSAPTRQQEFTVLAQTPSAGFAASPQTQIALTLYPPGGETTAPSPPGAAVPSVIGLKAAVAKARMIEAGFLVIFVSSDQPAPTKEEELTIQRHTPAAGALAPKGTRITLIVYPKGAETVETTLAGDEIEVPRVIDLDVKDAKRLLESKGAKIRLESANTPPTRDQAFTIEAQAPEAGTKIRRGTTVVLRVYPAFEH